MPADNADVGVDLAGDNIDEGGDCDCGRLGNRAARTCARRRRGGRRRISSRRSSSGSVRMVPRGHHAGAAHVAVRRGMFDAPDGDPTDDSGNGRLYYVRLRFYGGGRAGRGSWG